MVYNINKKRERRKTMTRKEIEREVKKQTDKWEKDMFRVKKEKELKQKGKGWMIDCYPW